MVVLPSLLPALKSKRAKLCGGYGQGVTPLKIGHFPGSWGGTCTPAANVDLTDDEFSRIEVELAKIDIHGDRTDEDIAKLRHML